MLRNLIKIVSFLLALLLIVVLLEGWSARLRQAQADLRALQATVGHMLDKMGRQAEDIGLLYSWFQEKEERKL